MRSDVYSAAMRGRGFAHTDLQRAQPEERAIDHRREPLARPGPSPRSSAGRRREREVRVNLAVGGDRPLARDPRPAGSTRNTPTPVGRSRGHEDTGRDVRRRAPTGFTPSSRHPSPSGVAAVCGAQRVVDAGLDQRGGEQHVACDHRRQPLGLLRRRPELGDRQRARARRWPRTAPARRRGPAARAPGTAPRCRARCRPCASGSAMPSRPASASSRHSSRSTRSSLASISFTRSTVTEPGEDLRGEVADGDPALRRARSSRAVARAAGLNAGSVSSSSCVDPRDLDRPCRPVMSSIGHVDDVGDEPRALLELDQPDRAAGSRTPGPAGSGSPRSCRRCRGRSPRACPTRTSRTCRNAAAAGGAASGTPRTAGSAAGAPSRPRRRSGCRASDRDGASAGAASARSPRRARAAAASRPLPGLNLRMRNSCRPTGSPSMRVVLDAGGDEVADAEPGLLLLGDRLDDTARHQVVADVEHAVVLLLAVRRDDRREARRLDQVEQLVLLVRPRWPTGRHRDSAPASSRPGASPRGAMISPCTDAAAACGSV